MTLTAIEQARITIQNRIETGLPAYRNPIEKHNENPASLRCAINAKCYECVGAGQDANYRDSIRTCTSYSCPLYTVRPFIKPLN